MASKRKRFADDGWAIWIDGDDTTTIYLNEWLNPKGKSYVDMGIRIRGVKATRQLNVYIPFPVSEKEIEDISPMLREADILRGIFSSTCIIDYKKNAVTSEIAYNGRTIDLIHVSEAGFTLQPLADGSLMKVDLEKIHAYLDNDESYLLFRLPHKSLDEIFKPRVDVGSILERLRDLITSPVISEQYGYSIRINEGRLLPSEINRIGTFHRQKLKKAVVTISMNEIYELNDSNCYRIRRLEEKLYQNYVPTGFDCEDAITYQWNQSRDFNLQGHFNFYFDIAYNAISRMSMFVYMILLMVIGIVGGALWDFLKVLMGLNW